MGKDFLDYDDLKTINKPLLGIAFTIYLIIFIWIVIFKMANVGTLTNPNIIAFASKDYAYRFMYQFREIHYEDKGAMLEFIGNIFVTFPFGLYLPLFFNRKTNILRDLLIGLAVITAVEMTQWLTRLGGISYRDFISNLWSIWLGELVFKFIIQNYCSNRVINYINAGVIVGFSPLALYAIIITCMRYELYIPYYSLLF